MDIGTIKCSRGMAKVRLDVPRGQQIKHWRKGVFYEHQLLEHIAKTYSGGTFIDGGSALGNHTLFFALYCGCSVISVEPILETLEYQKSILELNNITDNVTIVNAALGSENGTCDMVRFGPGVGHWRCGEGNNTQLITLDTLWQRLLLEDCQRDGITLIKLDVEYSEINALVGAKGVIETYRPGVIVESNTRQEIETIKKILAPYGYKMTGKFPSVNYEFRC